MFKLRKFTFMLLLGVVITSCNQEVIVDTMSLKSSVTNGKSFPLPGEFSWLVKIDTCAGVIINDRFILTVAHCVYEKPANLITINGGGNGLIRSLTRLPKVKRVIPHPDYVPFSDSTIKENDIALLELRDSITFSNDLNKVSLQGNEHISMNQNYILAGFGRIEGKTYPKKLYYIENLELLPTYASSFWQDFKNSEILNSDDPNQDFIGTFNTGNYFAVKVNEKQSACRGDSGAPIVNKETDQLIGLVSHGSDDCENQKSFFIINIKNYLGWIENESL